MGKRSDFARIEKDKYYTWDIKAYPPLLAHVPRRSTFIEPCAGAGDMVTNLELKGLNCALMFDIDGEHPMPRRDAFSLTKEEASRANYIITNPPWTRDILHKMILHFQELRPTWLLFDSNWANSKRATPYLKHCAKIVPIGRLKWIKDSQYSSKDDCSWYLFDKSWRTDFSKFYGRTH